MHEKGKPLIAIGWDVRGWRGSDQAVAMLSFAAGSSTPVWLGVSGRFQFEPGEQFGLRSLLAPVPGERLHDPDLAGATVVAGIDAPLAFPARFVSLMKSENQSGYCTA